jgi:hypothetical protein
MPIGPFLAGQAFEPETIREMSLALEQVCDAPSLKLVDNAATRLIAGKIVELAQRGVRGVSTLTSMTLKEFQRVRQGTGPSPQFHSGNSLPCQASARVPGTQCPVCNLIQCLRSGGPLPLHKTAGSAPGSLNDRRLGGASL